MTCIAIVLAIALALGASTVITATQCDPTFVTQKANVFTVLPTGTNDTINLQCAFDAAVEAGPGSTVQLAQGTYYIDRDISVVNFDGSFAGAGKQQTFIQNLDAVPFPHHGGPGGPYFFQTWPGLFVFFQDQNGGPSSISISDLTFRAMGSAVPTNMHGGFILNSMNILEIYGKVTGIRDDEVSFVDTSLIRVGFEGQAGSEFTYGYNVLNAVEISGDGPMLPCGDSNCVEYVKPISGNHLVQDCTFENAVWGYVPLMINDSSVKVENSTFENVRMPIDIFDFSNSTVDIQHNSIHNATWYGVYIENGVQAMLGWDLGPHGELPEPSIVNISHNSISVTETGDGIGIADWGFLAGETTIENAVIGNNIISLEGTTYGAIFGIGASGIKVLNNRVFGQGAFGIYAGLSDDPVANWVLVGNNLQNANTEYPSIILGPSTSNFTVVGGHNSANVLDLGSNNVITGINVSRDTNLGQLVHDAMLDRRDMKRP
jgi:hypothetical protein